MTFDQMLEQVRELLRTNRRAAYEGLKIRFGLNDAELNGLKAELIKAERVAVDEDGEVLVWVGDSARGAASAKRKTPARSRSRAKAKTAPRTKRSARKNENLHDVFPSPRISQNEPPNEQANLHRPPEKP